MTHLNKCTCTGLTNGFIMNSYTINELTKPFNFFYTLYSNNTKIKRCASEIPSYKISEDMKKKPGYLTITNMNIGVEKYVVIQVGRVTSLLLILW